MSRRFVIAIDNGKVYLRKTLCVTHHAESGEVQYDTKPIKPSRVTWPVRLLFEYAKQIEKWK